MDNRQPFIYLAPIRGLTDALFRRTFFNHFDGYDAAVAPFINPQKKALYSDKMLTDVLPENNSNHTIIPQILHTDPDDFLLLADRLEKIGHTHINWNLGCPAPMVTRKKRGSGLLPYPEKISDFLARVIPKLGIELSIKTRLGLNNITEIQTLLPMLNQFPLKEITIHARLGKQLYKGSANVEGFKKCQQLSKHTLVYNGDINSGEQFRLVGQHLPSIQRWMLGRGALGNPFLAEEIKNPSSSNNRVQKKQRLLDFHADLYQKYQQRLDGPGHLLSRVKQLWIYLIVSFPGKEKILKRILKAKTLDRYHSAIGQLFDL